MRQLASIVVFLCLIAALAGRQILQPAIEYPVGGHSSGPRIP
jgi:hypothetical protein